MDHVDNLEVQDPQTEDSEDDSEATRSCPSPVDNKDIMAFVYHVQSGKFAKEYKVKVKVKICKKITDFLALTCFSSL